jgi:transcriptional regulator with XRE-family HTH domain
MNQIRAARLARGWNQQKLALMSGVGARTISNIENGKPCRQDTKRRLLLALGIPFRQHREYFA